jgi:hypothetical protein
MSVSRAPCSRVELWLNRAKILVVAVRSGGLAYVSQLLGEPNTRPGDYLHRRSHSAYHRCFP